MTQSIEYVVKVNGAQQGAAQVSLVEKSLERTEAAAVRTGAAVDKAVRPTRNLGQAGLEVSRALEDLQYGFNGIVNNIPSLVMGLGATAGVAGALSLVAVSANQVIKNWGSITSAFGSDDAILKQTKETIVDLANAFDRDLNARLKEGRDRLQDLKDELRDFGLTSRDKTLEEEYRTLEDLEKRRANLDKNRRFLQAKANAAESAREKANFETANAILQEADRRAAALDRAVRETESRIIALNKTAAGLRGKEAGVEDRQKREKDQKEAEKAAEALARLRYDMFVAELNEEDEALKAVNKARAKDAKKHRDEMERDMLRAQKDAKREEAKAERDAEREMERARKRAADERIREHKKMLQEIADAEKKFSDYAIGLGEMVTGQLASNLTDYLVMKAEGEKDAEQKAVASFLSATGKQLVASGVKGVFEGAIMSANPLTPGAGAGMIATGGAAIVAGMAMAGGGAAIAASLPADTSPTSATRDPGASPRGSSLDSGGGGPMIINVSYGAGGPLPEDIAREIGRVVNSGNRRRGAA